MIEKIDIIDTTIYCYDEQFNLVKNLELSEIQNIDFAYLQGAKLLTLNITQPIKRIIKFTELNDFNARAVFTEYPYEDMTEQQQTDFNSLVQQVENL
jgi:hypothetical protein